MNYFVRKDSDYSILSLELIQDGHTDYKSFFSEIQDATVTFSMVDADTGLIKVANRRAEVCVDDADCQIIYRFEPRDVNTSGSYIGNFNIVFNSTKEKLIVPVRDQLNIHIMK